MNISGGASSQYHKPDGSLKDGYSYSADSGGKKVGKYTIGLMGNRGRPSIGTNTKVGANSRDIYKLPAPPPPPAPSPAVVAPDPEPEPVKEEEPVVPSEKLAKAKSYTRAYQDFRRSGAAVEQMAGNLQARQDFLDDYKLNLQSYRKGFEPPLENTLK